MGESGHSTPRARPVLGNGGGRPDDDSALQARRDCDAPAGQYFYVLKQPSTYTKAHTEGVRRRTWRQPKGNGGHAVGEPGKGPGRA